MIIYSQLYPKRLILQFRYRKFVKCLKSDFLPKIYVREVDERLWIIFLTGVGYTIVYQSTDNKEGAPNTGHLHNPNQRVNLQPELKSLVLQAPSMLLLGYQ